MTGGMDECMNGGGLGVMVVLFHGWSYPAGRK